MQVIIENWSGDGLVPRGSIRRRCMQREYDYVEFVPSALHPSVYLAQLVPEILSWTDPIYILKLFPDKPEVSEEFAFWIIKNGFDIDFGRRQKDGSVDRSKLHADFYGDKLKRLLVGDLTIPLTREDVSELNTREQVRDSIREGKARRGAEYE